MPGRWPARQEGEQKAQKNAPETTKGEREQSLLLLLVDHALTKRLRCTQCPAAAGDLRLLWLE